MSNMQWEEVADDVYSVHSREALDSAYSHWLSEKHDEVAFSDCVYVGPDNPTYPIVVTFSRQEDGPDLATKEDLDAIHQIWAEAKPNGN